MIGWLVRAHTLHLLDEVKWLREELRAATDRNARLQEQFLTLHVNHPVFTTLPTVPRAEDTTAQTLASVAREIDEMRIGEMPA